MNNWMSELMALGGFQPRAARVAQNDSTHSPHTKKRHKPLRGRELKRREAQSRNARRRGGKKNR